MAPEIDRTPPPSQQIADYFRERIRDGDLPEGARLPAHTEIVTEWGVASATATKAIGLLVTERLVITSPRGTFVAARETKGSTPQDRITRAHSTGSTDAIGEVHQVTAAGIVPAPVYVSELLGLADATPPVVRREHITSEDARPRALTVCWYPASLADTVPELLSTDARLVGGMLARIEDTTGGRVVTGRDYLHARTADRREATALGVPIGTSILAVTWLAWSDIDRVIEYGEQCLPQRVTLTYPYDIASAQPPDNPA